MMFSLLIRLRSTEYYNNYQGVRYVPYCPAAGVVPHSLLTSRTYIEDESILEERGGLTGCGNSIVGPGICNRSFTSDRFGDKVCESLLVKERLSYFLCHRTSTGTLSPRDNIMHCPLTTGRQWPGNLIELRGEEDRESLSFFVSFRVLSDLWTHPG